MKKPRQLLLQTFEHNRYGRGLAILQQVNGDPGKTKQIVRIWRTPLEATIGQVIERVKASGHRASVLDRSKGAPIHLSESDGVHLAVLFLAIKPLRKLRRIEGIASAVKEMELEETYYWLAKCSRSDIGRRACHALRVLLAKE